MKKIPGDIIILNMCTKNYDHMMYDSWDMERDGQTNKEGETEGQEKWHIEVGVPTHPPPTHILNLLRQTFVYIAIDFFALSRY